ncbi:membrane protein [Candidatus Photodesmus blepharus]|uniref:Probable lipid II flippase MurJ n=1 Tax=Candidatus Photodesmus blepharonis TaxID=1179155 RepID=A0A084CMI5_9GAMM|nr:murein biosynthesis integral membrane protein MurJ [Candidatus Photodesmus blepharus]KEY91014.1 membrane protein [Candidatus Photodesmus blepharus]
MNKFLFKSGIIVSAMTLISRILGILRDIVIANLMGASDSADVFFFANKIPNFLRRLFAEGAFSQAFIPVLSEYHANGDMNQTREFIAIISGTLGAIISVVTILGVLGSGIIAALFGAGWFIDWLNNGPESKKFELASLILKITFPYLWFITFVALSGSVLNSIGRFAVSSFTPVFLNIMIIIAAYFISPNVSEPEIGLAVGVFLGGLVQFLFQFPFLIRAKILVKPKWGWQDPGMIKIRTLMIPSLFGVSVGQINLLFDTFIASFLTTGAISWLYYSDRLLELPLGLFGIAVATVILPSLSKNHVNLQNENFAHTMDWGIRVVALFGVPAMFGLMVLAKPILIVLFVRGEFTSNDANQASSSLLAYASGLLNFMLIKVLATGYYSRKDTRTPVKCGIIAMITNMVFNAVFVCFYSYVGLAIATALSAFVNMSLLYRGLHLQGVYQLTYKTIVFIGKLVIAGCLMAVVILYQLDDVSLWLTWCFGHQLEELAILIVLGSSMYLMIIFWFGIRLKDLRITIHQS